MWMPSPERARSVLFSRPRSMLMAMPGSWHICTMSSVQTFGADVAGRLHVGVTGGRCADSERGAERENARAAPGGQQRACWPAAPAKRPAARRPSAPARPASCWPSAWSWARPPRHRSSTCRCSPAARRTTASRSRDGAAGPAPSAARWQLAGLACPTARRPPRAWPAAPAPKSPSRRAPRPRPGPGGAAGSGWRRACG